MGRKASWPPKVYRHPSGAARCYYKGRSYYLGPYGSDAAAAAYAALLVRLTAGEASTPSNSPSKLPNVSTPTVADVAAAFLAAAAKDRRAVQLKLYTSAIAPLLRLYGRTLAAEFDALQLEQVRAAMVSGSWMTPEEKASREHRRQPICWCRSYTHAQVRRLLTVWRWAERQRMVPRGSWANLRTLPALRVNTPGVREMPRRQGTSRADLEAVLPFVQPGRRHRPCAAMLETQFLTGMRSCEVCQMRPCDIDREGGPCVDGVRVWLYRPAHYKTENTGGPPRVIAIGPQAQAILAPWLLLCPAPDAYLFRPARRPYAYSTPSYDANIRRACERAGVKIQPYESRHSMATRVKQAYGIEEARAVLGHASLAMTHAYGEQRDMQKAAEVAAKLG